MKNYKIHYLLLISAIFFFIGCTNDKQSLSSPASEGAQVAKVLLTENALPKRKVDKKTGLLIPYLATPNPYLAQKGRIKKQSVVQYIEARRAFKSKNYTRAESILQSLVKADKELSGPWVMLGDIAQNENDLNTASQRYIKALEVSNLNLTAYIRLAKVQRVKGEYIDAQNTYTKALSVWKDFPEAHLNLAILYDIYLNAPVKAQRHMEAYQFLTNGKNRKVAKWLQELQKRTGLDIELEVEETKPAASPSV